MERKYIVMGRRGDQFVPMDWEREVEEIHARVPLVDDIGAVGETSAFYPLPDDWVLVTADVMESTRHSAEGRYRDVNLVGASCITACLNAAGRRGLPFFFGGDGALLACPASLAPKMLAAVLGVADLAGTAFGFKLRVGGYPVSRLREAGQGVRVARVRVSPELDQYLFEGGGVLEADKWLKLGDAGLATGLSAVEPDLEGLECRWKEIPSKHGEIASLLVWAPPGHGGVYREVMARVGEIVGDRPHRHPLRPEMMELEDDASAHRSGLLLSYPGVPAMIRAGWGITRALAMKLAEGLRRWRPVIGSTDWGAYFDGVVKFSDNEKFCGLLAMVFACGSGQRAELEGYLAAENAAGRLCYGMHVSKAALLTCMVFDRHSRHFHFVDGADGGYTMAALQLKKQLAAFRK